MPKCASHWSSERPGKKVLPKILCHHFTSLSLFSKKDQIHERQAMQFQEFPTSDIKTRNETLYLVPFFSYSFRLKNVGREEVASDFAAQ